MAFTVQDVRAFVVPWVPGAPLPAVDLAIIQAAKEFCERTYVDQVWTAAQTVAAGVKLVVLSPPAPTKEVIAAVLSVRIDGVETPAVLPEALDAGYTTRAWRSASNGTPVYVTYDAHNPNALSFSPPPATPVTLEVKMARAPRHEATIGGVSPTTAFSSALDRWVEVIGAGARARLHAQPDTPYSKAEFVKSERVDFMQGIGRARTAVLTGGQDINLTIQPRPFA